MTTPQTSQVLTLLQQRGSHGLTQLEALQEVGTLRLGARIFDLRKAGHRITTHTVETSNGARIAKYTLETEEQRRQ